MLSCLRVRNLAIIEELEVEFGPGLNIVTGETGAGKTMLVAALQLVLGSRARPDMVRTGAAQADIEALFEPSSLHTRSRVRELDLGDGTEIVVRRVIKATGRSRAYINGRLCTLAELRTLCSQLVDISSQHEHTTLVDAATHLHFLDAFGGHEVMRERVSQSWSLVREAHRAVQELLKRYRDRAQREDLLRLQVDELQAAAPVEGELDELLVELTRMRHAGALLRAASQATDLLEGDDGVVRQIGRVEQVLSEVSAHDATLADLEERLASALTDLQELAYDLAAYARSVDVHPERLHQLEGRVSLLKRLLRKYGGDEAGLVELGTKAAEELQAFDDFEYLLDQASTRASALLADAAEAARALSKARHLRSAELSEAITRELRELGMGSAQVEVQVAPLEGGQEELQVDGARLTEVGLDRVEFLIAPNPGEPPRPLARVASGGELSRSLLAIKRVLAGSGPVGLYVFDEVDSGVGGGVAEVIGRKIRQVAQHHQVLCITHQAQIAAYADDHFFVSKRVHEQRTTSHIAQLDGDGQAGELARMMGGVTIGNATRQAANELLERAHGGPC